MPELGFGASGAVGVGGDEAADPSSPSGASHSAEEKSTGARPRSISRPSSASSSSCDDMAWGGTHRFVEAGLGRIRMTVGIDQLVRPSPGVRTLSPLAIANPWRGMQQPASRLDLRGGTTEYSRPSRKNGFAIICYHQFSTHSSRGGRWTSSVGRPNSRCHHDRRPSYIRP